MLNKPLEDNKRMSMWPIGFLAAGIVAMVLGWVLQDVDRTTAMAPDAVIVSQ